MSSPAKGSRRLLITGWDAADWRVIHPLMDAGKMPHLRGFIAAARGEDEEALRHLEVAERADPSRPGLHIQIGEDEVIDFENAGRVAAHLSLLSHERPAKAQAEVVTVVAGLPRSGTSMLMQMLAVGGMPILSDGVREADEDNPRGYLELEDAKGLRSDAGFLEGGAGHAVKIVAQLLPYLPREEGRLYRVVFTQRDLDEVMASQRVMLARAGREPAESERGDVKLREIFHRQLVRLRGVLAQRPDVDTLFVHYPDVVADPVATAKAVADFVQAGLDAAAMATVVDGQLHRQRS
ncbi:MAG: sulfotransferase [Myxococcales bacterium]|nr:sulfotransferase [Myxococcales bacterium]